MVLLGVRPLLRRVLTYPLATSQLCSAEPASNHFRSGPVNLFRAARDAGARRMVMLGGIHPSDETGKPLPCAPITGRARDEAVRLIEAECQGGKGQAQEITPGGPSSSTSLTVVNASMFMKVWWYVGGGGGGGDKGGGQDPGEQAVSNLPFKWNL